MTTADYLESLQDDLSRTVEALDLEEGTNFTDIADMAENGDISTDGGADLSEYFNTNVEYRQNFEPSNWVNNNAFIKMPTINVDSRIKNVANLCYGIKLKYAPQIIFGDNITTLQNFLAYSSIKYCEMHNQNTGNVTNMSYMFNYCTQLLTVDLSGLDYSSVTTMESMFNKCAALTNVNFGNNVNSSSLTKLSSMFSDCASLIELDLSNMNMDNVTSTYRMFYGESYKMNLQKLDIRNLDFSNLTNFNDMFGGGASYRVDDNCLIIVKDDTSKTLLTNKFSRLTNVKTVAEYEGS